MAGRVLIITGPTATGKTALGVFCALRYNGEVVSADSMQIYQYMDIGTAKPTAEEMRGVPHHMIDCVSPFESYSVSRYAEEAAKCVDDILARGRLPIIVGGTGLYIDALVSGVSFADQPDAGLREELSASYDRLGGEEMLRALAEFDPDAAHRLHAADKKRIVRAFEIYRMTGKTVTQHDAETKLIPPRYEAVKTALTFADRDELYARIERRVDLMMERGLTDEVRRLIDMGVPADSTAMQAIGYKELYLALSGKCTLSEAVDAVKQGSRRYAKRQLSWLRRDESVHWLTWKNNPDFSVGSRFFDRFFGNVQI